MISIMKVVEATGLTTVSLATHETLYKLLSLRILIKLRSLMKVIYYSTLPPGGGRVVCWSVGGGRVEYIMYP